MNQIHYRTIAILLTVFFFFLPVTMRAQATKWESIAGRNGIELGYNKFEDYSIVRTKRNVVRGVVGKGNVFDPFANERVMEMVLAFTHKGQKITNATPDIILFIMPKATTNFGKIFQTLEKYGDSSAEFYISSNSKVFAIADEERFDFGRFSKSNSLNVWGEFSGNAYINIPLTEARKLAHAKKMEFAIGSIEIKFPKRDFFERFRQLIIELDARSNK